MKRFWDKVNQRDPGSCWPWTGDRDDAGYGRFYDRKGHYVRAHRFAYSLSTGDPAGKVVRHSCDNPSCCNPAHLLLGSQLDNIRDRQERGRQARLRGIANGHAKLTEDAVLHIRALGGAGASMRRLARQFNTDRRNIQFILERKTWAHL